MYIYIYTCSYIISTTGCPLSKKNERICSEIDMLCRRGISSSNVSSGGSRRCSSDSIMYGHLWSCW